MKLTTTITTVLLLATTLLPAARAQDTATFDDAALQMLREAEEITQRARAGHVLHDGVRAPLAAVRAFLRELPPGPRRANLTEAMNLLALEATLGGLALEDARTLMDLGYLPAGPRAGLREAIVRVRAAVVDDAPARPALAALRELEERAADAAAIRPYTAMLHAALDRAEVYRPLPAAPQPAAPTAGLGGALDAALGGGAIVIAAGSTGGADPEWAEAPPAPTVGFGWQSSAEAKADRHVVKAGEEVNLEFGATIPDQGGATLHAWWVKPDGARVAISGDWERPGQDFMTIAPDTLMTGSSSDRVLTRGVHQVLVELRLADGRVHRARTIVIAR